MFIGIFECSVILIISSVLYNESLLHYNICWLLLASWFLSDPFFINQYICFRLPLCQYSMWSGPHILSMVRSQWQRAWCIDNGVWCGSRWWRKHLHKSKGKILPARHLFLQYEDRSRVPVRLPDPQGTDKTISADRVIVRPCDRDHNCDPSFDAATYILDGFLKFFH